MDTATVTIGRNIGETPMAPTAWVSYVDDVRRTLRRAQADTAYVDTASGGSWQGVAEDAHVFVAPLDDGADRQALRAELATLAERYAQDAIGLTIGPGELVSASVPTPA